MLFTDTERRFESVRLSQSVDAAKTNEGNIQNIEDSTLSWMSYSMKDLIKYIGNSHVDEISPQQIYDWHQQVEERTSAVTANNYLRAINLTFNRLVKKGIIAQNPGSYVPYLEQPDNGPKAIRHETYQQLRNHADTRMRAILDLLWDSGCRLNGLLSIRIQTIEIWREDEKLCLAAKVKEKGRNGRKRGQRHRTIYAQEEQAQSIINWMNERPAKTDTSLLFTTYKGAALTKNTLHSLFRRLKIRANIQTGTIANIHSFRHAFAIRKLDEGYDLAVVSAWLGHSDPAFTARIYCVRTEDQLRKKYFK